MKKFVLKTLLCLSAIALVGCGPNNQNGNPDDPGITDKEDVKVAGLELAESATVDCGFTKQLTANVLPENATNKNVTWSSANPEIATVDQTGLVTGVNHGTTKITCTTEDGGIKRECEVTVEGYRLSDKIFNNFGKLELNDYNVDSEGFEQYKIDDSHEDYIEFSFNRKTTKEWSSARLWYNPKDTITSLDVEVELVQGTVPAIMVEFAGESDFKQFKRIPLTVGQTSKLHVNMTDYNIKTGDEGNGSWGFIFFELNNPNDKSDTTRELDDECVLRFKKVSFTEGEKEVPEKINNFRYEAKAKKLVFEKDIAAQNYDLEVYKVDGENETKLDLETQMTRFTTYGESIPNMEVAFTPKHTDTVNQDFSSVPGNYKARVRGKNSAGEGAWTEFHEFTVKDSGNPDVTKGYVHKNMANDGAIYPNQWNGNKTLAADLTDDGYKLTFTSSATAENPSWDSFLVDFDKTQKFETLTLKFEVVKSAVPLNDCAIQFNDWAESEPESTDAQIQHFFSIGDRTGVIEETVTINKDLSKGLGNIGLMFDRTAGAGEVEILIKEISLNKKEVASAYVHNNIANDGVIYPNQWNGNKTLAAELTENGYKLSFTSVATAEAVSWDSFLVDFDKTQTYTSLTFKFEVVKSAVPLNECVIEFTDWAESEPESSDAKIQHIYTIADKTGVITETVNIDKDLSKGLGNISFGFDRTAGAGDVEILVKEISLNK